MPDSACSGLLLLRELNFFPHLDLCQTNLTLVSDQCLDECPLIEVNAVSGGHLNTSHSDILLQDILQNQTVRVTDYRIVSISTYIHSSFAGLFCVCFVLVWCMCFPFMGVYFVNVYFCTFVFSTVHCTVHISWGSILCEKVLRVASDL